MMRVTVKTLDGVDHPFDVESHITIAAFKEKISQEINVPVECQRIIFHGRILQDSATIADSGIGDRVVHLVTRPPPGSSSVGTVSSSTGTNQQGGGEAGSIGANNPASATGMPNMVDIMRTIFQSNLGPMLPSGQRANRNGSQTRTGATGQPEGAGGNEDQENSHQRISMARVRRRYIQRVLQDRLMPLIQRMDEMYPSQRDVPDVSTETVNKEPAERESATMETDTPSGSDAQREEGGNSGGGSLDPELSNPLTIDALADITSEVEAAWNRLALHLPRWRGVLREWATSVPSEADRQQRQEQEFQFYDVMSAALHLYSHLLHNISDFMIDLSLPPPRHLMVLSGVAHQEIIEASIHLEASEFPHNLDGTTPPSQSNAANVETSNVVIPPATYTTDENNGDLGSRLRRMNVHSGNFGDLQLNNPMPSVISNAGGTFTVPIMVPGGFGMPLSTLMAENTGQSSMSGIHSHFAPHLAHAHLTSGSSQDPTQDDAHHQQNPLQGSMADPYLPCDSRHFLPPDIVIRSRQLQTALSGQDSSAEGETGERRAQTNGNGSAVHINIPIVAAGITSSGFFPDLEGLTPPINVISGMNQPRATFRHTNRFPIATATAGAPLFRPNFIVTRGSAFNLRGQGRGAERNTRPSRSVVAGGNPAEDVRILLSIGREALDRLIQLLMPSSFSPMGTNALLDELSMTQIFRQSPGWHDFFKRLFTTSRPPMNIVQFSRLMESWIHRLSDRLQGQNNEQSYYGAVTLSSFLPISALLRAFDDTRNPLFTWLEEQTRLTEEDGRLQTGTSLPNVRTRDRLRSLALRLTFEWIHLVERDWLMTLPRALSRQWIRPLVVLCLNHILKTLQMFSAFRTDFGFGPLLCTYLLRWQMNLCNLLRTFIAQPGTEDILTQRYSSARQDGYHEWSTYLRNVRAHGPRSIFQRLTETQEQQFSILLHSRWSNALCLNMTNSHPLSNILWRFTFFLYHCIEYGISATPSMANEAGLADLSEQANINLLRTSLQGYFITSSTHIRHDQTRENLFLDMLVNLNERESAANGVNSSMFHPGVRADGTIWNLSLAEETQIMNFYEQELLNVPESRQPISNLTDSANVESETVEFSNDLSVNPMGSDSEGDNNSGFVTPPLDMPDRMTMDIESASNRRTVEDLDRQLVVELADIPINDPLAATITLTPQAFSQEQQQRFLESVGMETVVAEQARLTDMPPEWFPIIAADNVLLSQRRSANQGTSTGSQTRFSDAYISGMPAKRRKLMQQRQDRISGQVCEDLLQDCIQTATKQAAKNEGDASISTPATRLPTTEEIGPVDRQLHDAFFEFVVEQLAERIQVDADFSPERFPNAARLFRRNDSQN